MKLTDIIDSTRERVLVFGGPKAGKTELVARLAEEFYLDYFDLENGYKTMRKLPKAWQERINLYQIPDTRIWPVAISTMLKVITGLPTTFCVKHANTQCASCKKDGLPYETVELNALPADHIVCVDSGTQLALSAMSHIKKGQDELAKPVWEEFASQGMLMDKFLSQVQHAHFNVCFITHEVEAELENGGKKLVPVAGTREFSRSTAKYFDHVVYCELKNKKHTFGSATDYAMSVLTGSRGDIAIEKLGTASLLPFFRHEVAKASGAEAATAAVLNKGSTAAVEEKASVKDVAEKLVADVEKILGPIPTTTVGDISESIKVPAPPPKDETMKEKLARIKIEREAKAKAGVA